MHTDIASLKAAIRDVPDFPKKGIIFKDITPLLSQPRSFLAAIDALAAPYRDKQIQKVACIEARGFMFGAPVAAALGAGLVPIRKKGKLPSKTVSYTYHLEYGTDTLEMHADAILPGERVLLVDDVLATGGTASATASMLRDNGADIVGIAFLIELGFLNGRKSLDGIDVHAVLQY